MCDVNLKKGYWHCRESLRDFLRDTVVDPMRTSVVRGQKIDIGFSNPLEGFRISTYSSKEPETLDWIDESVSTGSILFDIGANIGLYSIYAAKKFSTAQIFAFEPEALNFTRLTRNIRANHLGNITPMNIALAEKTAFGYLYLSDTVASSALHSFGDPQPDPKKLRQGIVGVSLDDLVFRLGFPAPTHIKLDVDGIEEKIILGASQVLGSPSLISLLVEINSHDVETSAIHSFLRAKGFRVSDKSSREHKTGDLQTKNYIYSKV